MPSGKQPLRQRLFRQRGASVASVSPDDVSPHNQVPSQQESSLLQQKLSKTQQQRRNSPLPSVVSPVITNNQSSWNNTEPDDDNYEGGGAKKDNGCNAEQRDRLAKCQKSLEQLEFSLNNLLLSASLAANQRRNQRRLEDADRFFSDLVDSIRNNRANRRRWPKACKAANWQQEKESAEESAAMRKKLQDESRALWRAQHIGAKCEDTVDRYMLDVVVDKLGEMADGADMNDCGGNTGRKNGGHRRPQACNRCGGVSKRGGGGRAGHAGSSGEVTGEASSDGGANKHNSCSEPRDSTDLVGQHPPQRRRQQQANNRSDEASISFKKRMQLRDDAPRAKRSQQQQRKLQQQQPQQEPQQQPQQQNSDATTSDNQQVASDQWTLRTWQPVTAASDANNNDNLNNCNSNNNNCNCNNNNCNSNNNNCNCNNNNCNSNNNNCNNSSCCVADSNANNMACACNCRRSSELVASIAAYQRGSRRYEKALRVAAYLRDLCREFYRTSCSGRAPPAAHALESTMEVLRQLVSMRDRTVALAIRCTACPALCSAERLSSSQLCRLKTLMRLACTQDRCGVGQLDLAEALADADKSPSRCRLLRQLCLVATSTGSPDADYRRLINAIASLAELKNCSANYNAHRRRMCGTLRPLAPGIRGVTRGDMRALALDLAVAGAKVDGGGGSRRLCRERCPGRFSARRGKRGGQGRDMEPALVEALHNPKEMRRRLQMHRFATGATLAVKAEENFVEP